MLITADAEGCWNPFENIQEFKSFKEIKTKEEAYEIGYSQGKLMKELGFNINLAPVVDIKDTIWGCRSFEGNSKEISQKANNYINGLQKSKIMATAKHYPGKTLIINDSHKVLTYAEIGEEDLIPFDEAIENNVSAIMVSHLIVNGSVNSNFKPSDSSEELIKELRSKYSGLIITDEINMLGLKDYYKNKEKMYIELFKADNDIILNFNRDAKEIYDMIKMVEKAVKKGEIKEERIDASLKRIFKAKGIKVID